MLKSLYKIELLRIIKTSATEQDAKERLIKTLTLKKHKEQIAWLEKNKYIFYISAKIESGGLVKNTSWPEFDHVVIYLELNRDAAIHYKLVWGK